LATPRKYRTSGGRIMTCPVCGAKTIVTNTRSKTDSLERRRLCLKCGFKFRTVEVDKDYFERMVKNNGKS
jgi:transcriptional regulator NrdR family protein